MYYLTNSTHSTVSHVLLSKNSAQKFSSESFLLEMFLKICRGVAELHSKSPPLAHRDIKPENILLTEDYEPILTDFGSVTEAEVLISSRSEALLLQEHAAQFSSMAYRAPGRKLHEVTQASINLYHILE
jgi:serine/threonine protein kinase